MHDEHPHPLLAQVPLTVSPFLSLPTATPLPYTYKQLPSTLPPSILSSPPNASNPASHSTSSTSHPDPSNQNPQQQPTPGPAYITSSTSRTAASPDSILSSCLALQSHLSSLESSARSTLQEWEDRRRAQDLAEKRRVAPGWLDNDVHLLVPANVSNADRAAEAGRVGNGGGGQGVGGAGRGGGGRPQNERRTSVGMKDGVQDSAQGEELDRVFGGLDIK